MSERLTWKQFYVLGKLDGRGPTGRKSIDARIDTLRRMQELGWLGHGVATWWITAKGKDVLAEFTKRFEAGEVKPR